MDNLGEIEKLLETQNLLKLNEEKAESLYRTITAGEIEAVIKKLPAHKSPGLEGFTEKFYKTFKEELTSILHRLFQNVQEDRRLPNSFYEACIILIPKPDTDTTKKENYRPLSLMNIDAKIHSNIGKLHPAIH